MNGSSHVDKETSTLPRTARFLLAVTCFTVAMSLGQAAPSASSSNRGTRQLAASEHSVQAQVKHLRKEIAYYRRATWYWQDQSVSPHTRTAHINRSLQAVAQLHWVERLWVRRANQARLYAQHPPHLSQLLCIHSYEGSWSDHGYPYWGGLQMDRAFMAGYGAVLVRKYGGRLKLAWDPLHQQVDLQAFGGEADRWTPLQQMWVAERAIASRGFWPWPNTARFCGLIPR